jgi:hypothetical protein
VIFWSPWISLAERSHSSFALGVFCVQVRKCFLLPVMTMRDVSGKSKPMRVGLHTGILRLRTPMSYPIFMPKPSTHRMHDPASIVPHIRPKVFTDIQMSRIKYKYYINSVSKDYDDSQWNKIAEDSITPQERQPGQHVAKNSSLKNSSPSSSSEQHV